MKSNTTRSNMALCRTSYIIPKAYDIKLITKLSVHKETLIKSPDLYMYRNLCEVFSAPNTPGISCVQ